jgi:hypothetical protein
MDHSKNPPARPHVEKDPTDYYRLTKIRTSKSRKFRLTSTVYQVTFADITQTFKPEELNKLIHRILNSVIEETTAEAHLRPTDRVRLSLNHPNLKTEVWIPFISPSDLNANVILQEVERVQQSNTKFNLFDGKTTLTWIHAAIPYGEGYADDHLTADKTQFVKKKKSIVTIRNQEDNNCLARAIVVAKVHAERPTPLSKTWKEFWGKFRQSTSKEQRQQAIALLKEASIPENTACGPQEWDRFQQVLTPTYRLKIYGLSQSKKKPDVLYTGNGDIVGLTLHIYHRDEGHYDVITSMPGFTSSSYYCEICEKAYQNREDHVRCRNACPHCLSPIPCQPISPITCQQCERYFVSSTCYLNHVKIHDGQRYSTCQLKMCCTTCGYDISRRSMTTHRCRGSLRCKICKINYDPNDGHKCFVQSPSETNRVSNEYGVKYIFFDFECRQDNENGEHIPNFCVAQRACDYCMHLPINDDCPTCSLLPGGRETVFKGDETLPKFCEWLFMTLPHPDKKNKKTLAHKHVTCIAHNSQSYDSQFILRHLVQQSVVLPRVIMNGSKILCMTVQGIRFIDSLNFLPMPLSKIPNTFELTENKKGYFPHFFNTKDNQNYVGVYPDIQYYDPDGMKPEDISLNGTTPK